MFNRKLILGSGSPRRKEIMTNMGYEYEIVKSEKDEVTTKDKPYDVVMELAYNKALEVNEIVNNKYGDDSYVVLTADTVVAVDDRILGKPKDREDAFNMIKLINNRAHQVYTGVAIMAYVDEKILFDIQSGVNTRVLCNDVSKTESGKSIIIFYDKTDVFVKNITDDEIKEYVATGECDDKAGSYAIQGIFGKYIEKYEGDYENVVGLPGKRVDEVLKMLND